MLPAAIMEAPYPTDLATTSISDNSTQEEILEVVQLVESIFTDLTDRLMCQWVTLLPKPRIISSALYWSSAMYFNWPTELSRERLRWMSMVKQLTKNFPMLHFDLVNQATCASFALGENDRLARVPRVKIRDYLSYTRRPRLYMRNLISPCKHRPVIG